MVMAFLLVEVARPAHELVSGGAWCYGWSLWESAVEAALENALDVSAVRRATACGREGAMTGGVHALSAMLLGAAKDAEYRAVAHLGMGIAVEGAAHDLFDVRSELARPAEHALGRPVAVVVMGFRSVLGQSDSGAFASVATVVASHADPTVSALDDAGSRAHVDELLPQLVGDAVVAVVEFDVVVDVGARGLALGDLESQLREWLHCRQVQGFECLTSVARELLKAPIVELLYELGDGVVELDQAEEPTIAEPCEDPALGDQYTHLDFGFALGLSRRCRDDDHAVVLRELVERLVDVRIVAIGARHGAAQLIGHDDAGRGAKVFEGAYGARREVRNGLGECDLREGVVAGAEHRDEQLDLVHLAGIRIDEEGPFPRVVDEQLLTGAMRLPHAEPPLVAPACVQLAELAVLVGHNARFSRSELVLTPEQLEGDAGARQLRVYPVEVDGVASLGLATADVSEQSVFDLRLREWLGVGPREARFCGALDVAAYRRGRDVTRNSYLAMRAAQIRMQTKNFSNLAHGQSPHGPGPSLLVASADRPSVIECSGTLIGSAER